jgi:aryl-alcohol dehydrogenase-like predicted oxidoreductase
LASQLNVTPPAVALAYVLNRFVRILAAVGTRSDDHLRDLIAGADLDLGVDDLARLEG